MDDSKPPILPEILQEHMMDADPALIRPLENGEVQCLACGHRCKILPQQVGICRMRWNPGGKLRVPAGYVAGLALDPIEKKPFFHVYPGENALSFGMLGCNLRCPYCQNWTHSQTLRDPRAHSTFEAIEARQIVDMALRHECRILVSTYNEPLITAEWAISIFEIARREDMICGFVSNGLASPEVLRHLRPHLDLFKVDLKTMDPENYRKLGGNLDCTLDSLREMKSLGYWIEIVTLVVPGFNDSDEEFIAIARFLADLDPDIPWHVTAFYPQYRMEDGIPTPASTLERAHSIGCAAGLRHVYAGNLPGRLGDLESTSCAHCGSMLVHRVGFRILENRISGGCCPDCGGKIAGIWD